VLSSWAQGGLGVALGKGSRGGPWQERRGLLGRWVAPAWDWCELARALDFGHAAVRREELIGARLDLPEHLRVVVAVKGREAAQQDVDDDADAPQVNLARGQGAGGGGRVGVTWPVKRPATWQGPPSAASVSAPLPLP
jgi:hypothetical protein